MNAHRRMEAKRERRIARTTGATRGKVRGHLTRGLERARLMNEGEQRIFTMVRSTRTPSVAKRMKRKAPRP
jgi:hypothetical protein